jgi:hypothetical protein
MQLVLSEGEGPRRASAASVRFLKTHQLHSQLLQKFLSYPNSDEREHDEPRFLKPYSESELDNFAQAGCNSWGLLLTCPPFLVQG